MSRRATVRGYTSGPWDMESAAGEGKKDGAEQRRARERRCTLWVLGVETSTCGRLGCVVESSNKIKSSRVNTVMRRRFSPPAILLRPVGTTATRAPADVVDASALECRGQVVEDVGNTAVDGLALALAFIATACAGVRYVLEHRQSVEGGGGAESCVGGGGVEHGRALLALGRGARANTGGEDGVGGADIEDGGTHETSPVSRGAIGRSRCRAKRDER
ncbi:hypothetical protein B0H14DRAFT_2739991 [Mycena olivaceomarginata]|nr:hypothetical protein B0H14DRAFT_2739991 [Mycena olivaceomarginata]